MTLAAVLGCAEISISGEDVAGRHGFGDPDTWGFDRSGDIRGKLTSGRAARSPAHNLAVGVATDESERQLRRFFEGAREAEVAEFYIAIVHGDIVNGERLDWGCWFPRSEARPSQWRCE